MNGRTVHPDDPGRSRRGTTEGAGHLADNPESRGAGAGGLVIGRTVVFNGRRGGRERGGGVDTTKIVIRAADGVAWRGSAATA
ncbi:hypothetical protein [Nocardia sp. NPDC050710]|uniref:hypothetical protein n=1 Tax=Nocardia sp. NPDC050710 TaxID=3157220 RepID=UPI0033FB573F